MQIIVSGINARVNVAPQSAGRRRYTDPKSPGHRDYLRTIARGRFLFGPRSFRGSGLLWQGKRPKGAGKRAEDRRRGRRWYTPKTILHILRERDMFYSARVCEPIPTRSFGKEYDDIVFSGTPGDDYLHKTERPVASAHPPRPVFGFSDKR